MHTRVAFSHCVCLGSPNNSPATRCWGALTPPWVRVPLLPRIAPPLPRVHLSCLRCGHPAIFSYEHLLHLDTEPFCRWCRGSSESVALFWVPHPLCRTFGITSLKGPWDSPSTSLSFLREMRVLYLYTLNLGILPSRCDWSFLPLLGGEEKRDFFPAPTDRPCHSSAPVSRWYCVCDFLHRGVGRVPSPACPECGGPNHSVPHLCLAFLTNL